MPRLEPPAVAEPRQRRWQPWLLGLAPFVATLLAIAAIFLLGSRLHDLLARLAGRLFGTVSDNLEVVVAISVAGLGLIWLVIGAKCLLESRRAD